MPELVRMGDLAAKPPEEESEAFKAIVASIDLNFPEGWREWPVFNFSFRDLFGGDQLPQTIEVKLRFAIPTVDLARAFDPATCSLSERSYRSIRAKILKWPLGRALLYSPHSLMEKIHAPSYNIFMDTVANLKHLFTKRSDASCELGGKEKKRASSGDTSQSKRLASTPSSTTSLTQGSSDHLLATVLSQQTELLNRMLGMQSEQNEHVRQLLQQRGGSSNPASAGDADLDKSFGSLPDSTSSGKESNCQLEQSGETELRSAIADAQRKLARLQRARSPESELNFDFTPTTSGQEPKIAKADPEVLKHGINCQKFRDTDWRNVRYAEIQKQFQATPAFVALKPNNLLAGITPEWKSSSILERFDTTLGAITNGLIQQRLVFQNLLESLPADMKKKVGENFITADSKFRKTSDFLLQYVCGRRAEVLQHRREIYKPKSKALRAILHEIPPSETHLFEEKAFAEAVKEQGGIHKFFLDKKRSAKICYIRPPTGKPMELARSESNFGQAKLCIVSSAVRQASLPHATETIEAATLQRPSSDVSLTGTDSERIRMVVSERPQEFSHPLRRSIGLYSDRCSRSGMGCCSEQRLFLGDVVTSSEEVAQQYEGALDNTRGPSTTQLGNSRKDNNPSVRQPNKRRLHQQTGRDEILDTSRNDTENPSILRTTSMPFDCPPYPGPIQWNSGQLIKTERPAGMASEAECDIYDISEVWETGDRPVCVEEISGSSHLRQRECGRQEQLIHGRVQQDMAVQTGLDISTPVAYTACIATSSNIGGQIPSDSPNLGESILGTRTSTTIGRTTHANTRPPREPDRPTNKPPSTASRSAKFGGLDGSGWSAQIKDWSESEITLLESSWRKSTLKSYKPVWARWINWASINNVPRNNPSAQSLAKYLCYLHETAKLAPRTIAVHKSVVANFGNPLRANELSSHPLVRHVIKGIFTAKPPSRAAISWRIEDMIDFLKTYVICEDNLFAVARHTSILLLLASGRRVHDLTLLSLENGAFEDRGDEILFWPLFGSKTDSTSYRQSGWLLKERGKELDYRLDIVYWVRKYIRVSGERRRTRDIKNLFITTRGVIKPASRTVIASWIRTLFREASISASAGSFRAAVATHNWASNQYSIDEILRRGNWQSKSTFFKYYFKEVNSPPKANMNVLNESFAAV